MKRLLILAGVAAIGSAQAADFFEVEDNNTKAAANTFLGLVAGDTINGITTGSSTTVAGIGSADYFRVGLAASALGIYQHRLTLTTLGTAGHVGSIRGLTQTAGVPNAGTDATFQSSSTATTPPRYNQWYGFGKAEELYYRVAGTASTTLEYKATLSSTLITPTDIGTFLAGTIRISTQGQGHTSDTDLWIYDSNLDAIAGYGNDDNSIAGGGTGAGFESVLTRSYAPGVYYMALTNFQFGNNLGSPADDDFQTGTVTDFPNVAVNSSTAIGVNMAFGFTDSSAVEVDFAATKVSQYDVNWYKFTVVPEPGTFFALGAGLVGLAVARRKRTR